MATYSDLKPTLKLYIHTVFQAANFCFATSTGLRSPTFYFAENGLASLNTANACGRLRTQHDRGPLIDVTNSKKGHVFFDNKKELEKVIRKIRSTQNQARRRRYMNDIESKYRTAPQVGDNHFEYTKRTPYDVKRTHPSGGRVFLNPRPTNEQVYLIIDRLLEDDCTIKVDGSVQPGWNDKWMQNNNYMRRVHVRGLAAYLQSL